MEITPNRIHLVSTTEITKGDNFITLSLTSKTGNKVLLFSSTKIFFLFFIETGSIYSRNIRSNEIRRHLHGILFCRMYECVTIFVVFSNVQLFVPRLNRVK